MVTHKTRRSKQTSQQGQSRNETVRDTETNTNTLVTRINTFVNQRNTAITVINTIVTITSIVVALRAMRVGRHVINDTDDQAQRLPWKLRLFTVMWTVLVRSETTEGRKDPVMMGLAAAY